MTAAGVSCFHDPAASTSVNGVIVHHSSTAALALACGLLLAGCSAQDPRLANQPATHTVEPDGPGDAGEVIPADPHAAPTWDQHAVDSASGRALEAMRAYARRDLDPQAWYEQLAGYLSAGGQAAFYGTDPRLVPVTAVAGVAAVSSPSAYLAAVTVDTDAGPYRVLLVRQAGDVDWLVERIEPAE